MIRRLSRPLRLLVALVAFTALSRLTAAGAVLPVSQSRQVSTFAFLDAVPGEEPLRSEETIQSEADGAFSEHAVCHVEKSGSYVTALADQESAIGPDGVSARIGISAEGRLVPPALGTLGIASSGLIYDFDVDAPTACRVVARYRATGNGVLDIAIQNRGGVDVVRWQFFDTEDSLEHVEILPAGEYRLTAGGGGDGATGPNGSGASFATLDVEMSFPTSASAQVTAEPASPPMAFPNPTRSTVMLYNPAGIVGSVRIFDAAGRVIRELDGEGRTRTAWDTRDASGIPVPAGIYFLRWGHGSGASVAVIR